MIDLYFLIHEVIAQTFIPIAEPAIPTGIQNFEANPEIETQTVTVEPKTSNCSAQFKYLSSIRYRGIETFCP